MKKLLQFGAGKIGRSFIAQLFSKSGYQIIFADIDPCLVKSLNEARSYNVIIKGNGEESKYVVQNVSAIEIAARKEIIQAITDADIISISVGKKSLLKLARILSDGIAKRYPQRMDSPIDIILAENVRDAAELLSGEMEKYSESFPLRDYVGFVETSIGKMVPLMTADQLRDDALAIFAEPYNSLILDANGFRGKIPDIPELFPKKNMKAWVDRKIFIHNLGHAILAYQCNYHYPEIKYIWEALEMKEIYSITKNAMLQSAQILQNIHPDEFKLSSLRDHVEDLLKRFSNKALCDTIFRVGCDIPRKLKEDDRLFVPVISGIKTGMNYDLILETWVKGCYFSARDDDGKYFPEDRKFIQVYKRSPLRILSEHCTFDPPVYNRLLDEIKQIMTRTPKPVRLS